MHLNPLQSAKRKLLKLFTISLFIPISVFAQETSGISFHGNAGIYGELYSIKGLSARRPHLTGRAFVRGNVDWDGFKLPIDIFLSSEDEIVRQTINRISLGYQNSWLDLRAGDAYPMYSPLLAQGVFLRGVHTTVKANNIVVQFEGGQNQRAIDGDLPLGRSGTYERFFWISKAGYESPKYFGFVHALRAKDEIGSITTPGFFATPQENLVVGSLIGARFLENALEAKVELNRALWTKDIRELPSERGAIPGAFTSLFRERSSTVSDVALRADVSYRTMGTSVSAMYQRAGSDYMTLGVFGFQSDWEEVRLQAYAPLMNYTLNLSGLFSTKQDNLNGSKSATTTRTNGGAQVGYRFNETYGIQTNYYFYFDRNDAKTSFSQIDQRTHNVMLQGIRDWGEFSERQHLDLSIGYQTVNDNVVRQFGSFDYSRISLGGNYTRNFSLLFSGYVNYQFGKNKTSFSAVTTHNAALGANYAIVQNVTNAGAQFGFSKESAGNGTIDNSQFQLRLFALHRFSTTLSLQLDIEGTFYSAQSGVSINMTEWKSGITLTQQF